MGPSIVDICFLLFLPLAVIGLLSFPVTGAHEGSRTRSLIDGAVAGTGLWFLIYLLVIQPSQATQMMGNSGLIASLVFPIADAFVIAVASTVLVRISIAVRREVALLAGGLSLLVIQAVISIALLSRDASITTGWPVVMAELGLLLVVFAGVVALRASRDGATKPVTALEQKFECLLPALPFAPVVIGLLTALLFAYQGRPLTSAGVAIGVFMALLLLVRQLASARDRGSLTARLTQREQLFRSLVLGSSDLITLHDSDAALRYASPALAATVGRPESELEGMDFTELVHPEDRHRLVAAFSDVRSVDGRDVDVVMRLMTPDGQWRWVETLLNNKLDDDSVSGIVGNTRDVHDQHVLRERLVYESCHDSLTALGNLAAARQVLSDYCYGPGGEPTTLILADLDGFKTINDTFGHAFGDALLVAVSNRLRSCVDDPDVIARIGGDEFVVILDASEDATEQATRIMRALRRPVLVEGNLLVAEASIGIARSVDARNVDELLRNADLAMYTAKGAGRNRVASYDRAMYETTALRMAIQEGLRRALENSNFELVYQPIVALPQGTIVGGEALLRWEDPQLGKVFPDVFIPVAEGTGLIAEIDMWVLNEVCRQIAEWREQGITPPRISINVSRQQLTSELPDRVAEALERHGLDGPALCIEVTEGAVAPNPLVVGEVLTQLQQLGVTISLDDFGTGQSSLSQLARLPIDRVKIDKSFVMPSTNDPEALALLKSIVGICHTLSLPIIAEGIEDEGAVANLAAMKCQLGQGYYFARPLSTEAFRDSLTAIVPSPRGPSALSHNTQPPMVT